MINGLEITRNAAIHVCCAPCASYPFEWLKKEYNICAFYSNSNIEPEKEYFQRLDSFLKLCEMNKIEYCIGKYEPEEWRDFVKGLENEPERGKRCSKCIYFRLKKTFDFAQKNNIENVCTVLTIAPFKDSKMIFEIGEKLSFEYGINFLKIDFKKKDGYKKTREIAKSNDYYIQNYCGCIYSLISRSKTK